MTKERSRRRRILVSCAVFLMVVSMIATLSGCGCAARREEEPVHEEENIVNNAQDEDDNADDTDDTADADADENTTDDETDAEVDGQQTYDISEDEANWDGTDPGESAGEDVAVQDDTPNTNAWVNYSEDPVKKDKDWR